MTLRQRGADRALPWFVLALFVVLTGLASWYVWRTTRAVDRARFDNAVQTTHDAIVSRLDAYVNALTATRAVAVADPAVQRDELRAYIRSLSVQTRYPGIQGIGFSVRVPPDEIEGLEIEMRQEGYRGFRVWPEGPRSEVHSIVLLEPQDERNRAAMGYDMFTDPVRREAMVSARDRGRPIASAPVTLVQEIDRRKQTGFLIYTPIYLTGSTPPTIEERREALVGFVYAPFRTDDLLRGIFGSQQRPEIGFEIFDGNELLHRTEDLPPDPRYTAEDHIEIGGRVWRVRWFSRRSGLAGASLFSAGTLVGGLAIGVLLFLLIRVQLQAREQAELTAERLRVSEAELQRANRAKDEFLATLSHELRTPMTSIMGWSQMLDEEDLDDATRNQAIDAIRKSARVQAQLIDDLLDVSRITAGKMRLDVKPIEVGPVVTAAIQTVQAAADAKGVRLHADLGDGIVVTGDPHRMQQVVWNLLSNAVKFTPADGDVFVVARSDDHSAVVEVRDTGHGIEPDFMPHLFERFRQADSSTTRSHMGLGLGLAIVRHLVELHGGTIAAESKGLGKGAVFRVKLPLAREPVEEAEKNDAELAEALRGVRVLVVDDDAELRGYVTAVFRASGADVRDAASARAALKLLAEWPADIVLSDLAMPEADGFDLLHWIRTSDVERLRTTPVVALTAFAMPEDRDRALEGGFQGFVPKPVEPETLRRAVWSALALRRAPSPEAPASR
jgi:signal transduction histidine kinase/ActR/RegA family two-component response regulator